MESGSNDYDPLTGLTKGVERNVTTEQKARRTELLKRFSYVFSKNELDLGKTSLAKHRIDTGDAKPMRQTLRRQLFYLLEKIDEHGKEMLKAGVIEASSSPWTSNIVVVKKKDASLRFCVDYRKIDSVTRRDAYPLPRIDACLDALSRAKLFSAFITRCRCTRMMQIRLLLL